MARGIVVFRTRFAPSPTGPLHLGHAYSALLAQGMAHDAGGEFLLRIEDIDQSRARPHWEAQIYDDLSWLGLSWPEPVMRQSDRLPAYHAALCDLWQRGFLYPCSCKRRDILEAASAPNEGAPLMGPDGVIYPGTCHPPHEFSHNSGEMPRDVALRLSLGLAMQALELDDPLSFQETGLGPNGESGKISFTAQQLQSQVGDIILARLGMGTSYHLAVVLDDAAQGITHIVRGQDLFEATKIHILLQRILGLPTPIYHHHALIRDENGQRLAKRDDARAIAKYREDGLDKNGICSSIKLLPDKYIV